MESIQSWVTACHVNPGDATLHFLEGSNRFHKAFREAKANDALFKKAGDWYKLESEDEINFYKSRGCLAKSISCPRGSLVLWDSRTIHCGTEALKERIVPNIRCVVYLCYTPRILASSATIRKRITAFNELRTTNHYPHKPLLFSKLPNTYGQLLYQIAEIEPPILSPIGLKLVGY